MRARLLRFANQLRESYWFVPTVMAVAALLLAAGMVWLDSHHATDWMGPTAMALCGSPGWGTQPVVRRSAGR